MDEDSKSHPYCGIIRTVNEVRGWISQDNLQRVVMYVSWLAGYQWGDFDTSPIEAGAATTNAQTAAWFSHPIGAVTLAVCWDQSNGMVEVVLNGPFDEVLTARLDTMLYFN
jgi:hypothetical protein